jgi:hypothetical protein
MAQSPELGEKMIYDHLTSVKQNFIQRVKENKYDMDTSVILVMPVDILISKSCREGER